VAQEVIILPSRGQRNVVLAGKCFSVISADALFEVELDNTGRRMVGPGTKITGSKFRVIKFFETAGASNQIRFDAGDEEYQGSAFFTSGGTITAVVGDAATTPTYVGHGG